MNIKPFESLSEVLDHINRQPDPVWAAKQAIAECLDNNDFTLAMVLTKQLADNRREFQVTVSRTVSQTITRTAIAVGTAKECQRTLEEKFKELAGDMDFSGLEKDADYNVNVFERI